MGDKRQKREKGVYIYHEVRILRRFKKGGIEIFGFADLACLSFGFSVFALKTAVLPF